MPARRAAAPSNAVLLTVFAALVLAYFAVAALTTGRTLSAPELALDRAIPLRPAWTPVYLSMWVFSLLPVLVVRGTELRRRTILTYITVATSAYLVFLIYPTSAPRPDAVAGDGVLAWCLRTLYALDPPYNCFPSLHVAYAFLAALSVHRVHRGAGALAFAWAALIGVSTVFIKQHYVADVVSGAALAFVAYAICLYGFPPQSSFHVCTDSKRMTPWPKSLLCAVSSVILGMPPCVGT